MVVHLKSYSPSSTTAATTTSATILCLSCFIPLCAYCGWKLWFVRREGTGNNYWTSSCCLLPRHTSRVLHTHLHICNETWTPKGNRYCLIPWIDVLLLEFYADMSHYMVCGFFHFPPRVVKVNISTLAKYVNVNVMDCFVYYSYLFCLKLWNSKTRICSLYYVISSHSLSLSLLPCSH